MKKIVLMIALTLSYSLFMACDHSIPNDKQLTKTSESRDAYLDTNMITFRSQFQRQLGTGLSEIGFGITSDSLGNIYVTGYTMGELTGEPYFSFNIEDYDAFLAKYSPSGTLLWVRQWGTVQKDEIGESVACDSNNNVYVVGATKSNLDGNTNLGTEYLEDIFITKFNSEGTKIYTKQIGTYKHDHAYAVKIANDTVYVAGYSDNAIGSYAYLTKLKTDGTGVWTRKSVTLGWDYLYSIAIDPGNEDIYVTGITANDLEGKVLVARYNSSGTLLWKKTFGGGAGIDSYGLSIIVHKNGAVFVTGFTYGSISAASTSKGKRDFFIATISKSTGSILKTTQWGTTGDDQIEGMASDSQGNIYLVGYTEGNLDGNVHAGAYSDACIIKMNASHERLWTKTFGTEKNEKFKDIYIDTNDNIYVTGFTEGAISTPENLEGDILIFKNKFD